MAAPSQAPSWSQTRSFIREDFKRLCAAYDGGTLSRRVYWFFLPNFQAVLLYRVCRHLYLRNWRRSARLLSLAAQRLTGAEISPAAAIGPGCLIGHAFGMIVFGSFGARCTFLGQCAAMGNGIAPGYPVVGDDVIFGIQAMALGPVRIGNRARLGPAAVVNRDVPDDAVVLVLPANPIRSRSGA